MTNDTIQLPTLATAKAVDDKTYRLFSDELEPGLYPIDCRIRLVGALKKGNPYQQRVVAAADPWAILAKAMSKLNSTTLEALVHESLDISGEEATAVKAAATAAMQRIKDATERTLSGKLNGAVKWELMA